MYEWLYTHVPLTQQHAQYRQHWINIMSHQYGSICMIFFVFHFLLLLLLLLFLASLSVVNLLVNCPHMRLQVFTHALPRYDILFFTTGASSAYVSVSSRVTVLEVQYVLYIKDIIYSLLLSHTCIHVCDRGTISFSIPSLSLPFFLPSFFHQSIILLSLSSSCFPIFSLPSTPG